MATVRRHRGKWQVQVRRKGYPAISKSFLAKDDALRWARELERSVDRGEALQAVDPVSERRVLAEILERYEAEVSSRKRSPSDRFHLRSIKDAIGRKAIAELVPADLAVFRDARLRRVTASTVRKEMSLFVNVLSVANREWGETFLLEGFKVVRKPAAARGRERRIEPAEWPVLLDAMRGLKNPVIRLVVKFALATGMRRGEVLSLVWPNIDLKNRVALLPLTKSGAARKVPLSTSAVQVLHERREAAQRAPKELAGPSCELVFPVTANAVRLSWERLRRKAGAADLRFHDLRHEAISRFFEQGLSVPEVALISGHKDSRMILRYTQLRAENIAKKLE